MPPTGTLSSETFLTSSRLRRNTAEIFDMTKMGNSLLEQGLYLWGLLLMVDVPLRHPVPVRTTPASSRPPTISSGIFPHTPRHDPSRISWSSVDAPFGRFQQSPEPMIAILEHPEEPTTAPEVPPSFQQPDIQHRRQVPVPLQVSVPELEPITVSRGRQPSGSGSAPFDPRGLTGDPSRDVRTSTTSDEIQLTPLQSPATSFNGWAPSPSVESQSPSRPNSFTDRRNGNGTYSTGRPFVDWV
jgi:hypothetical protein